MGVTESLARWLVDTGYEAMPPEAVDSAKEVILDTLGATLAGATQPVSRLAIDYARDAGGTPEAGVISGGYKTGAASAAFANGISASALDFDVTFLPLGHPVCTVFPAAFAIAEKLGVKGRNLIEAVVIGIEVQTKVGYGYSIQEGPARGSSVGVYGVIGATSTSAKLLGLDQWQTRMAFGIVASHASGNKKNSGTMAKPYHAGNAASGGVLGALLAKAGWTASSEPLEGPSGFADEFMDGRYDPSVTVAALGNPLSIVEPGAAIKTIPTCHRNLRGVAAVLKIVTDYDIKPEQVERVTVSVPHAGWMNQPDPDSGLMAKVSLQFNLAEAILKRKVDIDSFDDRRLDEPEVRSVMQRVKLLVDHSIPSQYRDAYNPVTVRLKDGRELTERVDVVHGEWGDQLSLDEVIDKYRDNAMRVLSPNECDRSIELVLNLEKLDSIAELTDLATYGAAQTASRQTAS